MTPPSPDSDSPQTAGGMPPGAAPQAAIPPPKPPGRNLGNSVLNALRALIRTRITAGLLIVLPVYVTYLLVSFVFTLLRDTSQWVVVACLESDAFQRIYNIFGENAPDEPIGVDALLAQYPWLKWGIAVFSVFLTIALLYAVGVITANVIGRRLVIFFESLLDRVPLVKTVYRASKQLLESVAASGDNAAFQRVALIPFPQEKMRCVGFVTSTFFDSESGDELATVFIPTTPNPTTGYLQILKRKELVELDWTVEEAIRTIMSAGILRPDYLTITRETANRLPGTPVPSQLSEQRKSP